MLAACFSLPISRAQRDRSLRSSTSFLSISSMRRRQSERFMERPRGERGRSGGINGGWRGVSSGGFFDLGNERRADDRGIRQAAKNRDVAGQRDAEANGDGKLGDFASAARKCWEIVG